MASSRRLILAPVVLSALLSGAVSCMTAAASSSLSLSSAKTPVSSDRRRLPHLVTFDGRSGRSSSLESAALDMVGDGNCLGDISGATLSCTNDAAEVAIAEISNLLVHDVEAIGEGIWWGGCLGNDDTVTASFDIVLHVSSSWASNPNAVDLYLAMDGGDAENGMCAVGSMSECGYLLIAEN